MRARLFYLGLCILVFAAIVHIAIVLMVPYYGRKDATRFIMADSAFGEFLRTRKDGLPMLPDGDPFFETAACKFDLDKSAILVSGERTPLYWSAAVFNRRGRVIYSLGRRSAIANRLSMMVVNPVQMAQVRQNQPDELETSIVVETTEPGGFVLIRVLKRDQSIVPEIDRFMQGLVCRDYETAIAVREDAATAQ